MVDFRRGITALGVFALFTGLAAAQVTGGTGQQQLVCATNTTVPPQLRAEGYTEQTGDIVIQCTGGAPLAPGQQVPLVNIAVYYNTTVTSRLLPVTTPQSSGQTSEALLLIDEPGSGLPGFGPSLPQLLCTTPLTGCASTVGTIAGNNTPVTSGTTAAPNVYQGVVLNNSVTFFGVPAMPPGTTGQRVYRITNVRVNANAIGGGSASGASPVQANITISGATSLPISNSTPNVGFVVPGLSASASGATGLNQCSTQTRSSVNTLTFTENFGTAFKTRVQAQSNSQFAGQLGILPANPNPGNQATPGTVYNSESNFVFPVGSSYAGLADFGTRLKATFNNIPTGARVFVSTANVNNNAFPAAVPAAIGGSTANGNSTTAAYVGYAALVTGESTSDGSTGPGSGFLPLVTASDNGPNGGNVPVAEVSLSAGTGTAVWEVLNTNPNTTESFKFAVYVTYTANVAQNSPAPGTSTVTLSFAPTATSGVASSSLTLPRFASNTTASNIFTVGICRTILLYPYITNQAGFDTGLTIANTSQDPYTTGNNATGAQSGSCKLTYYGGTTAAPTTPPAASDTGNIAAGTVWANTLQTIAPNFQGYMFAVCNFQYAHGFAFISDVGARNLAMGYLALVMGDPGTGSRNAQPFNGSVTSVGEQAAH